MAETTLTAVIQEAHVQGISTRSVDDVVKAMGMSVISKSQISLLCEETDGKVKALLARPLEVDWPYLWIDATYRKVWRGGGRIVYVAVIIAIGVNTDHKGCTGGVWRVHAVSYVIRSAPSRHAHESAHHRPCRGRQRSRRVAVRPA